MKFTSFDGEVYRIKNRNAKIPIAEKIHSAQDHAIPLQQGAAIYKNKLFLSFNTKANNDLIN